MQQMAIVLNILEILPSMWRDSNFYHNSWNGLGQMASMPFTLTTPIVLLPLQIGLQYDRWLWIWNRRMHFWDPDSHQSYNIPYSAFQMLIQHFSFSSKKQSKQK